MAITWMRLWSVSVQSAPLLVWPFFERVHPTWNDPGRSKGVGSLRLVEDWPDGEGRKLGRGSIGEDFIPEIADMS